MSNLMLTEDGPKVRHEDGTLSDAPSVPFYQRSWLGGWKPVCMRHNLIFMMPSSYHKHWTPTCEGVSPQEYPEHDMLEKNKNSKPKRVWL